MLLDEHNIEFDSFSGLNRALQQVVDGNGLKPFLAHLMQFQQIESFALGNVQADQLHHVAQVVIQFDDQG
ncbi:hypothetical protein D3C81_454040 [compost metagenome]